MGLCTITGLCSSCCCCFFFLFFNASHVRPALTSSFHERFFTFHTNISHDEAVSAQLLAGSSNIIAPGLSFDFYQASCPQAHAIVGQEVRRSMRNNPGEAAGLLRLLFHDCFVQGCDASILLKGPLSEQDAPPNNASLRLSSMRIIDSIKQNLEVACPQTVSCADTIVLASREAIFLAGGPLVRMPLGRKDAIAPAPIKLVLASLPSPLNGFKALLHNFQQHGLDLIDLVGLSGAHSIGEAHCKTLFEEPPSFISSNMENQFSRNVSKVCPKRSSQGDLTIHLDFLSKDRLDNNYFKNVLAKMVLFPSDLALLDNPQSKSLVNLFAHSQKTFFEQFSLSILKLSQIEVLIGIQGEIRHRCTKNNSS